MKRLAVVAVLGFVAALAGCAFLFNTPPTAMISATPEQGNCPITVEFSAADSYDDRGITAYRWDFGDGWGASGATCQHTYTHSGTYTARLTVEDEYGETDTASIRIVIYGLETYDRSFKAFAKAWSL